MGTVPMPVLAALLLPSTLVVIRETDSDATIAVVAAVEIGAAVIQDVITVEADGIGTTAGWAAGLGGAELAEPTEDLR